MHKINPYQKPGSTDPEFIIQKETANYINPSRLQSNVESEPRNRNSEEKKEGLPEDVMIVIVHDILADSTPAKDMQMRGNTNHDCCGVAISDPWGF